MTTYGVTDTGFVDKPIEIIKAELEADQKDPAVFGPEFDTSAQSPAGQINGIMASHLRELWEVAQAIYSAIDPDKATGTGLSALAATTGTVRRTATKSTVTATVHLEAGKTLKAGAVASVDGNPEARFVTTEDAVNVSSSADDIDVPMEAETAGPVVANHDSLTVIVSAQSGWDTVTNDSDAEIGLDIETDEELRIRREDDIRRAGSAMTDAIAADVRAVADVTSCTVDDNPTDDTDGLPPHSIEVLVLGGDEDAIAQAIWDSKAGGIETYGTSSGTAVDENDDEQTVNFTRPTPVPIFEHIHVTIDDTYPDDGDDQISTAIAVWGQANLKGGDDVVLSQQVAVIFGVSGVVDVTLIEAGTSADPSGTTNIAIGYRELATIDSGDVKVTST